MEIPNAYRLPNLADRWNKCYLICDNRGKERSEKPPLSIVRMDMCNYDIGRVDQNDTVCGIQS